MLSQAHPAVPAQPCKSTSHKHGDVESKSPELGSWRDDINMNNTTNPSTSSHQGYANSGLAESTSRGIDQVQAATDQQKDSNFSQPNRNPNIVHLASDPSSALDPNCNEPSLPCLCCNGYSPQDNNSTYNLNYINNNTVTFRQQGHSSSDDSYHEGARQTQQNPKLTQLPQSTPPGKEIDKTEEEDEEETHNRSEGFREEYADEDDTLIPSCWDCPPSLLEFSLSSFTSSSSTSISGCSDLESDCPDAISLSCQDFPPEQYPLAHPLNDDPQASIEESYPPLQSTLPGGYPTDLSTASSDSTEGEGPLEEDDGLLDLQKLSESVDELGKAIHRQAAQLAQWDLEGYLELRDEYDHLEELGQGNDLRGLDQVSSVFGGAGSGDFDRPSGRETSYKPLHCPDTSAESSASSVFDECFFPDSFISSPLLPPSQPAEIPVRDMDMRTFTYMNMNASTPSPPTTSSYSSSTSFSTASSSSSAPPREAKGPSSSLPVPPSQPIPYFTFHSSASSTSLPAPIPPPRRKRQARLEALRKTGVQSQGFPISQRPPLPPPPPLPPADPPPRSALHRPAPVLPPPPSFDALDDEIRKLLILAGVTQDELLKLGPELGVGVGELLEPECGKSTRPLETEESGTVGVREGRQDGAGPGRERDVYREKEREETWKEVKSSGVNRQMTKDRKVEGQAGKGVRETLRMTSFPELGRRQGANCSRSSSPSSSRNCEPSYDAGFDSYYSFTTSNAHSPNLSFHDNNANTPSPTAAPPSRPLPPSPPPLPQPPPLPRVNLRTFPAKKRRPEHFDWLIEFSPDTDTLSKPSAVNRAEESAVQKFPSGAKVTTFKELRRQSRQNPTPRVVHEEPHPTAITPEPDFLYSLKWTTMETVIDGRCWEYSTEAQTSVLQPPPITPLAPLKEMLPTGRGEPVLHPFPLIGCSICEHRLQMAEKEREEKDATKRGRADGGMDQDSSRTVCSLSFTESIQRGGALRTDGVRAQLSGQGLSSPCLEEKRALLSPISIAVDGILAQFNSSRTLVQKVQSGDSRVNPSLGRLVLQCLCPALSTLLSDGLKPYQTDLITGRRPNSPWGLVQACVGPGPSTQAMYRLQCQVSQLPQLRQSRHRFNAFLLGLLNVKLLDHWVFHLQSCDDVLETHYLPTSFMWLSRTSCQPLFEELLLLLQPLSLLTFSLDLLFQHHHFDPASPTPTPANYIRENSRPANQACSFRTKALSCWRSGQSSKAGTGGFEDRPKRRIAALANCSNNGQHNAVSANMGEAANNVLWLEREIAPPGVGKLSQQPGPVHQAWGSVVQWGRKLGQNWGSFNNNEPKAQSLPRDSWLRIGPLEYDYITHDAQRNPVPECNPRTPWVLGMLFGASRGPKDPRRCTMSARRPSRWLAPSVSVLSRIVAPAQNPASLERAGELEWDRDRERFGMREHPGLARPLRTHREHRPRGQLY